MSRSAGIKISIIVGALLAFVFVGHVTWAGIYRDRNPRLALAVAPQDAEARANRALELIVERPSRNLREEGRALALQALRRDPTNVSALRALGLVAEIEGKPRRALEIFNLSESLSKRDLLTQTWFIEHYSQKGDVDRTLNHYHTALRTTTRSQALLFPVLVKASADSRLVKPIAGLLAHRDEEWWDGLVHELIKSGPNLAHVVSILEGRLDMTDPTRRALVEQLLDRIVAAKDYDLAWNVYSQASPKARRMGEAKFVFDGKFEATDGFPPFDWALLDDPELNAVRGPAADPTQGNALWLTAYNSRSGEVARQLLRLPPGRYLLQLQTGDIPSNPLDRPVVQLKCDERKDNLLSLRPPTGAVKTLRGDFTVSDRCPWQWLSIRLSGDGAQTDLTPWIDNLEIKPAERS